MLSHVGPCCLLVHFQLSKHNDVFSAVLSRPSIWRCLIFSDLLFQCVAPKKEKSFRAARAAFIIWWKKGGGTSGDNSRFSIGKLSFVGFFIQNVSALRARLLSFDGKQVETIWRKLAIFTRKIEFGWLLHKTFPRCARGFYHVIENGGTIWRKLAIFK